MKLLFPCSILLMTAICVYGFGLNSKWNIFGRRDIVSFDKTATARQIHEFFMEMALAEATKAAQKDEVPIGALVVKDMGQKTYRILGRGGNRVETKWDASAHAEMQAMRQAARRAKNWRLLNTTLYSTLEPCPMCLAACQAFRVHSLVYGAPDLRLGAVETHIRLLESPHPYHNLSSVVKGVRSNSSSQLMKNFFFQRRIKRR